MYWTSRRFHELVLKNANKKRNKIVYYCKLTNIANNIFLALILVRLEAIYVLMLLTFFLFVVRVASGLIVSRRLNFSFHCVDVKLWRHMTVEDEIEGEIVYFYLFFVFMCVVLD